MTDQLPLFEPAQSVEPAAVRGDQRFAECRRRVPLGCGGHHYVGPQFAGMPVFMWFCCPTCPNRDELNPRRSQ
jgi:hypothetical protein